MRAITSISNATRRAAGAIVGALLFSVGTLSAQGSLATLGFGYPVGGLSTRAAGTAGAFGDFDPLSPLNPASVAGVRQIVMSAEAEPEYRKLRLDNGIIERTTTQRIPLIALIFPVPGRVTLGVSTTSFLDRSYSMITPGTARMDGEPIATSDRLDIRGAIGDSRVAVGWQVTPRLKLGLGGHLFMGEHKAAIQRRFTDTLVLGSVLDSSLVRFRGTGISFGAEFRILQGLAVTGSWRSGFGMEAKIHDTLATSADVPDRLGASLRYDGIAGTTLAVGVEQVSWSRMASLGLGTSTVRDATNIRAGIEVAGPNFRGVPVSFRAGYARNELPFSVPGEFVDETRMAAGMALPIARDAATMDFSLQRANRTLKGSGISESAWLFGVGLQIRP